VQECYATLDAKQNKCSQCLNMGATLWLAPSHLERNAKVSRNLMIVAAGRKAPSLLQTSCVRIFLSYTAYVRSLSLIFDLNQVRTENVSPY
jgi:uncharacterized protein with von Willebrand factor type A (vWA) domain